MSDIIISKPFQGSGVGAPYSATINFLATGTLIIVTVTNNVTLPAITVGGVTPTRQFRLNPYHYVDISTIKIAETGNKAISAYFNANTGLIMGILATKDPVTDNTTPNAVGGKSVTITPSRGDTIISLLIGSDHANPVYPPTNFTSIGSNSVVGSGGDWEMYMAAAYRQDVGTGSLTATWSSPSTSYGSMIFEIKRLLAGGSQAIWWN